MIDPQGLFSTARLLLGQSNKGAPNQARLRRGVSTAYYGLFHLALRSASDALVGINGRNQPRYETIYRSFQHRLMKDSCLAVDKPVLGARAAKAMGLPDAWCPRIDVHETRYPHGVLIKGPYRGAIRRGCFSGGLGVRSATHSCCRASTQPNEVSLCILSAWSIIAAFLGYR